MHLVSSRPLPSEYGIAVVSVALVAAARWACGPYLSGNSPLLPFTIAVVASACYGGRFPGLVATLIGGLAAQFLFLPHARSFFQATPEDLIDLAGFLLIGTVISLLIHRTHTARLKAHADRETAFAEEEKLRLLVDSVQDYALAVLDAEGRFISWNPGGLRLLGYPSADIIGRHYCCVFPDAANEANEPQQSLETAAALGRCETRDIRVKRDGLPMRSHTVLSAIHGDDGQLRGFAVVLRELMVETAVRVRKEEQDVVDV